MKAILVFNGQQLELEALSWTCKDGTITVFTSNGKQYTTGTQNILIIEDWVKTSI